MGFVTVDVDTVCTFMSYICPPLLEQSILLH